MILLDLTLLSAALLLAVPSSIFATQCLLALLPQRDSDGDAIRSSPAERPRTVVLVPAHDEAGGIEATVSALHGELDPGDAVLVVADNCSDDTAARARQAGAQVLERNEPSLRGKGFALAYGVGSLAADPPEVVIVLDADCRISKGGIERLARLARALNRPVQADYLIEPPEVPSPLSVVSGFALLVRNRVRPRGLKRIGLPCNLVGSGMAFPWDLIRGAKPQADHLVEDLDMGIDLALQGFPAVYCADARVTSPLPERNDAAESQRRRWEHGRLYTLRQRFTELLNAGVVQARPDLIALGLDLCVPPLALLIVLCAGLLAISGLGALLGLSSLPAGVVLASLAGMALSLVGAWARFARDRYPARFVLSVPLYLVWKLPVYLSLLGGKRQRTWVRTERDEG